MIDRWYYIRNKRKVGPVSMAELREATRVGQLGPSDKVLREGASHWVDAQSLVGLFATAQLVHPAPSSWQWLRRHSVWAGAGGGLVCVVLVLLVLSRTPSDSNADANGSTAHPAPLKNPDPISNPTPPKDVNPPKILVPAKSIPVAAGVADNFIQQLNKERRLVGLGSVSLDVDLSQSCQAHARYLLLNPGLSGPALFDEDSARTGFSNDGKLSAQSALIFFSDPARALHDALTRGDIRLLLLDRQLLTVGFGLIHTDQDTWFTVLDVRRGPAGPVVTYPGEGQKDVPTNYCGGAELEGPTNKQNAGFPISVVFPSSRAIAGAQATLTQGGTTIPTYFFTPDKPPPNYRNPPRLIGLIPKKPLTENTSYRVEVSAQIDGKGWSRSWTFATAVDPDAAGSLAPQALAYVNQFRQHAGLPAVVLDADLSRACRKHVNYLVQNYDHPKVKGLGAHEEDDALPGFSEEGRRAGKASVITQGFNYPLSSIDSWMATLYHRLPLLDPRLVRIGASSAHGPRMGWVSVLDASTGKSPGNFQKPVIYPVDGQRDVPLAFPAGGEVPDPIPDDKDGRAGYPITVTFPSGKKLVNAAGSVQDGQGRNVPVWFSSPEKPANPNFVRHQANTICMIAQDPLQANTVYRVRVQVNVDGQPWEKAWSFTTGPDGDSPAESAAKIMQRINLYRTQAGVGKVELHPESSSRCQAHVRYLILNAELRGTKQFSSNDENPELPGYSDEGKQVARGAYVYYKALSPLVQVETMIAGLTTRPSLLDPNARRIGFACGLEPGRGWTCVLDLHAEKIKMN